MACNNQSKKLNAFYHNQKLDYEKWLMENTRGQLRQGNRFTRPTKRLMLASAIAALSF